MEQALLSHALHPRSLAGVTSEDECRRVGHIGLLIAPLGEFRRLLFTFLLPWASERKFMRCEIGI